MDELMNQGCVNQALATGGGANMTEALGKLTGFQLNDLQRLLGQSIAVLGDTVIPGVIAGPIRRVSVADHFKEAGIAVDVQLGPAVFCLFAPDWLAGEMGAPSLAELFVQRLHELHRARRQHIDRFGRARRMIDAATERSSAGMTLVSLKTTPQRVDAPLTGRHLQLAATVSMLNDALEPYTQRIVAWTAREMASHLTHYGPDQRKHLRALTRMKANGAVLEIDALAERAIAIAGANLAACATALLTSCNPQTGLGEAITLSESADGETSIYLRSGRIMTFVLLSKVGVVSGHLFTIDRSFPETVTEALAGRAVTTIIDRPLLRIVRIASAQRYGSRQTLVRLRMSKRFISAAELDETMPLAA